MEALASTAGSGRSKSANCPRPSRSEPNRRPARRTPVPTAADASPNVIVHDVQTAPADRPRSEPAQNSFNPDDNRPQRITNVSPGITTETTAMV